MEGAVEDRRGEKEQREKAAQPGGPALGVPAQQQHGGPGQKHIKENAQQLDQVQVPDAGIGEEGQKIEVGDIVVPHRHGQGPEAPVGPEKVHPFGEKILVVQRLIGQGGQPQAEGGQQQRGAHQSGDGVQPPAPAARDGGWSQQPGAEQQKESENGLQGQKKNNTKVHKDFLRTSGQQKKERKPLPAENRYSEKNNAIMTK